MGHLCPGLNEITDFTIFLRFAKKNRGLNDFSHFTIFRYLFVFLTHQMGLLKSTKQFCENCEKSRLQLFVVLYDFSLLFCFSHLPGRPSQFNKFCEKKREKSRTQRFFPLNDFSLYFVFLTYQMALPNRTNSAKIEKIVVALYDFSLLLCCYHLPERASKFN